jgi:hypothetical protein
MFELNGQVVDLDFLMQKAKESNLDFNTYITKMKERGLVEKQAGSTVDPTMSQKSTGSQLDDGSSDSVSWFDQTWFITRIVCTIFRYSSWYFN